MAKYRRIPDIVDAEPYKEGMEDGYGCKLGTYCVFDNACVECTEWSPYIKTLGSNRRSNRHFISKGDYIITGIEGERYTCKPGIFKKIYEEVRDHV